MELLLVSDAACPTADWDHHEAASKRRQDGAAYQFIPKNPGDAAALNGRYRMTAITSPEETEPPSETFSSARTPER